MTLIEFTNIFAPLAVQLRFTDADEATIRTYYAAMKDLETEFVAMSAERLATLAERFPTTPTWRAMVRTIERERRDELRARLRSRTTPLCLACNDTGWKEATGLLAGRVTVCECRELRWLEVLGRRPMPALPSGDTA